MSNTNTVSNTIVENRYIAKLQLTADDMGGAGCKLWNDYRLTCDKLAKEAYNKVVGRSVDANLIGVLTAGLFEFFGIKVADSSAYHARILAALVVRKPQTSQALKDARKAKKLAKDIWDKAVEEEKSEEEIATFKTAYDNCCDTVDNLMLEPHNYWKDFVPMLDRSKKHATAEARKALEDVCADIINEREFMSAEELEAEAQRLADERKGRKIRKKAEAKAAEKVEAEIDANAEANA